MDIVIACDVINDRELKDILEKTADLDHVIGYKIGASLAICYGLGELVRIVRSYCPTKEIIYDHQKAGTDIPDIALKFMCSVKTAGVDSVILFPVMGPNTRKAWIEAAHFWKLKPIVGGLMTHRGYEASDGGHISFIMDIYRNACSEEEGVSNFVVPASKTQGGIIMEVLEEIAPKLTAFYMPGLVSPKSKIIALTTYLPKRAPAIPIIGRSIYTAKDIKSATLEWS
jgi:orotidine-5'-phosphate decarboxylase